MSDKRVVILTGAGVSAESGIGTFRDKGGLWATVDWRDVATPEGFARDPAAVLAFHDMRRAKVRTVLPNAAHRALARFEAAWRGEVLLVTQNVDDLHEKAGSRNLIHMHGAHASALCAACGHRWPAPEVIGIGDPCPCCRVAACRPDVVWFGETPYQMDRIMAALAQADVFVSIGTSGHVYPAAGFVRRAREAGAQCIELNLEDSNRTSMFHEVRRGPASRIVPDWVVGMLD